MTATERIIAATTPTLMDTRITPEVLGAAFARLIVELAPDGILVADDQGRILIANRHVEDLFGYAHGALIGVPVDTLLPARLQPAHGSHRARYAAAPAVRPMGTTLDELSGCRSDGSEFPVEIGLSPCTTEYGTATIAVIRDLTRQRADERLAHATSVTDEDERIAADLHDAVINHLFSCGLTLASVLSRKQLDDRLTEQLYDVIDELDAAIHDIHDIVFGRLTRDGRATRPTTPA